LTDRGPVLVELEGDGGDPIMEQLCFDSGLIQGRFEKLLDSIPEREKKDKEDRKARKLARMKRDISAMAKPRPARKSEFQTPEAETATRSDVVIAPVSSAATTNDSSATV
jgi:hypothetical protein